MSMAGATASLWKQIQDDVMAVVNRIHDRKRVLTINAGTMTLEAYDGMGTQNDAVYLRWPINAGDDVMILRYANREIIMGALSVPGDPTPPIPDMSQVDPGGEDTTNPDGSENI